jgi:Na+/glutamate symporter
MRSRTSFLRFPNQFIDYWSVPHFLLGMLIAMIVRVLEYPAVPLFFVTLIVAIIWEVFEMQVRIRESRINVISDIALPLVAYGLTLWITDSREMGHEQQVALLSVTIITYVLVSYAAWRARFDHDPDFLN